MSAFFRFPHTSHLAWLSPGQPRDDKVLSGAEAAALLSVPVLLEEKVDGANLGFSIGPDGDVRAQNRGQYLERPYSGQFAKLNSWLAQREEALFDALSGNLILFGEWMAAVHSLTYDRLPDYLLVFDIYDRERGRFWSTRRRDALAVRLGLAIVPTVGRGRYTLKELESLVITGQSAYRDGPHEGLYVRVEDEDWLLQRAKIVRPDFTQAIQTHWRAKTLRWNILNQGDERRVADQ